ESGDPPLSAATRVPHASEFAPVDLDVDQPKALVKIALVFGLEVIIRETRCPPLSARSWVPHGSVLAVSYAERDQAQALIEAAFVLRFEIIVTQTSDPPLCSAALPPHCKITHSSCHIGSSFLLLLS